MARDVLNRRKPCRIPVLHWDCSCDKTNDDSQQFRRPHTLPRPVVLDANCTDLDRFTIRDSTLEQSSEVRVRTRNVDNGTGGDVVDNDGFLERSFNDTVDTRRSSGTRTDVVSLRADNNRYNRADMAGNVKLTAEISNYSTAQQHEREKNLDREQLQKSTAILSLSWPGLIPTKL